jgi:hypothetical protein
MNSSSTDQRAAYVAVLRAIADTVEASVTIPLPSGYLSLFPPGLEATAAFLRAVPLPWKGSPPGAGEHFYTFQGDLGDYNRDGIRIYVNTTPGDVATGGKPEPVKVTEWTPLPEIAALLSEPEAGQ